jgi:acetoin utilization deacetylase AcuC-like enzyme
MTRTLAKPLLTALPVCYDDRMVVEIDSFSPSAGKPRAAMTSWRHLPIAVDIVCPVPVTHHQLSLAHDPTYVSGILSGRLRNGFGTKSGEVAASLAWTSGAMLSAARAAIANGRVAVAPCSGFHHAGHASGGGFCTFNGLMVAALTLLQEGEVARIGILDCDQHYGDGTDDILTELKLQGSVRHYSAGQFWRRTAQATTFLRSLPDIVASFRDCDVLLYQAGADPHVDDPLGGWLTTEQLAQRDQIVFDTANRLGIPVAWNLAGGYQQPLQRVLDIHDNTLLACAAQHLANVTCDQRMAA